MSLKGNRIKDAGCRALAKALSDNTTLRIFNIFGQQGGAKWGEATLSEWVVMYKTNVTLLNIIWSTSSKQTVALTSLQNRNGNINRALRDGRQAELLSLLPLALRAAPPPALHYFELPDVRQKRGGVAAAPVPAGRLASGAGKVMRNGVEDVAAAE